MCNDYKSLTEKAGYEIFNAAFTLLGTSLNHLRSGSIHLSDNIFGILRSYREYMTSGGEEKLDRLDDIRDYATRLSNFAKEEEAKQRRWLDEGKKPRR